MARPMWRGSINFGLVTVPVELYSATEDHTIHFRQFERNTSDRIRYRRVNERTGKEVDYNDIVKGYPLDGDYVLIEQQELDEIAPGRSRTIDIEEFVDLDDIDPIYFQKSYWLGPGKEEFDRAYSLLMQAMRKTNRAGIATFVMRNREYVAVVRAGEHVLVLDTLQFAEDIRDPKQELRSLPSANPRGKELDMAVNLIESMSDEWRPEQYRDQYTERVRQLIEDKKAGRTVTPEAKPQEPTKVVDLFEALSESVRGRQSGKQRRGKSGKQSGVKANTPTDQDTELSELSKTDLDRMARELEIKGRSKMTRAQLEEAIASAGKPRRKRAS